MCLYICVLGCRFVFFSLSSKAGGSGARGVGPDDEAQGEAKLGHCATRELQPDAAASESPPPRISHKSPHTTARAVRGRGSRRAVLRRFLGTCFSLPTVTRGIEQGTRSCPAHARRLTSRADGFRAFKIACPCGVYAGEEYLLPPDACWEKFALLRIDSERART